jgi:hypothetical protein
VKKGMRGLLKFGGCWLLRWRIGGSAPLDVNSLTLSINHYTFHGQLLVT